MSEPQVLSKNGKWLRQWQTERRYNNVTLATALGVSTATIGNYRASFEELPRTVILALEALDLNEVEKLTGLKEA